MNQVSIYNETDEKLNEIDELPKLIDYMIKFEKLDNLIFNVIIVDNEYIHKLNRDYRNIDRPTDVITFALEDNGKIELEGGRVLGDIYISIDKAKEQAKEYNHSLKRELSFLMVHGFLHLLGYDHMNEEDEKVMFDKQERILDSYGITR
jgi:probable rRNA maturation factor